MRKSLRVRKRLIITLLLISHTIASLVLLSNFASAAIDLPKEVSVLSRKVTFNSMAINGQGNEATVLPGSRINISANWTRALYDPSVPCSGCVVQAYYGIHDVMNACIFNKTENVWNSNRTATTNKSFNIPNVPGVYIINTKATYQFANGCPNGGNSFTASSANHIGSITVVGVSLFEHGGLEGREEEFGVGDFDLSERSFQGILTGYRIPEGLYVEAFENADFTGRRVVFGAGEGDVPYSFNDQISAIRITTGQNLSGLTTFHLGSSGTTQYSLEPGQHILFNNNNESRVRQVTVPSNYHAEIFVEEDYSGDSMVLGAGQHNLSELREGLFDNNVRSIKIRAIPSNESELANILLLSDYECDGESYFAQAFDELGYDYEVLGGEATFASRLDDNDWDMVILENTIYSLNEEVKTALIDHLNLGGRLFVNNLLWNESDSELLEHLGADNGIFEAITFTTNHSFKKTEHLSRATRQFTQLSYGTESTCVTPAADVDHQFPVGINAAGLLAASNNDDSEIAQLIVANQNRSWLFGGRVPLLSTDLNSDGEADGLTLAKNLMDSLHPVSGYSIDSNNELYFIDVSTGIKTKLWKISDVSQEIIDDDIVDITYGPGETLFALSVDAGSGEWNIVTLNIANPEDSSVNKLSNIVETHTLGSIAWDGTTLWLMTQTGALYGIDLNTYEATLVQDPDQAPLIPGFVAIAWDGDQLYGVRRGDGRLHSIDRSTGESLPINTNGNSGLPNNVKWGLSVDADNNLWAIGVSGEVYLLNKLTGEATLVSALEGIVTGSLAIRKAPQPRAEIFAESNFDESSNVSIEVSFLSYNGQESSIDFSPDEEAFFEVNPSNAGLNQSLVRQLNFTWRQVSGTPVELNNTNGTSLQFTAPEIVNLAQQASAQEELVFELVVNDGKGGIGKVERSIIIDNIYHAPTIDLVEVNGTRTDQNPTVSDVDIVNLTNESSDINGDISAYLWEQIVIADEPVVQIANPIAANTNFETPDVLKDYHLTFRLTVTDNDGGTDVHDFSVAVQNLNEDPLVVIADSFDTYEEGSTVELQARVTLPDGRQIVSVLWEQVAGIEISNPGELNNHILSFIAPEVSLEGETVTFRLSVTDNLETKSDEISFKIVNTVVPPTLTTDPDLTVEENSEVSLSAFGDDPDGDNSGLTYSWKQEAGVSLINLTGADSDTVSFTVPEVGLQGETITIKVTVTDEDGATESESIQVTVENISAARSGSDGNDVNSGSSSGGGGATGLLFLLLGTLRLYRRK